MKNKIIDFIENSIRYPGEKAIIEIKHDLGVTNYEQYKLELGLALVNHGKVYYVNNGVLGLLDEASTLGNDVKYLLEN